MSRTIDYSMRLRKYLLLLLVCALLIGLSYPESSANAAQLQSNVTAYDLIAAMNTMRVSYGNPVLIEDPIVNAVAQATAEYMAAYEMSWHIGDVRGRLAAAGYGGGATVWATENFAVGTNMSIDQIMLVWADDDHMRPAVTPAYCHVGAGVAKSANGMTYYVLQAAYTSENACGPYIYAGGTAEAGSSGTGGSQLIIPVQTATPDSEGRIYHDVASGQSFWSIAIAYHLTIQDLEIWNNLSRDDPLRVGQRLFIPGANTEGYATPTPVGMILPSTPDADGKVVHTVQAYQNLITIAGVYETTVDTILKLNNLQQDWPLQIGQKLLIFPGWVTPSPTPRPLTPIDKLTPASDGNYYHVVQSGETLSWIASLYQVTLADLTAWNNLVIDTIIRPDQKLLLLVTPPATSTATPAPPSATPTPAAATAIPTQPRLTSSPSATVELITSTPSTGFQLTTSKALLPGLAVLVAAALIGLGWMARKKR